MPNLNEMLDRIANLTENPRAAQRMLRMMPERRITTDLIGAANKQAEFKQEGLKFLDLKGKAFDPLLKAIAKDFTEYTKSVGTTNPWIGKTGTVLADFLSKGIMSASARELYERVRDPQQAGQLLLPAAGQTSASRMTRQMFEGLPAIQSPQIGMEQAPLSRAASYMVNKARRALGMSIGPASPYSQNPFAGAATVPPRSFFRFGQGPQLPGAPIQAALPPAGTTTNYGGGGFFGYGGVTGSGGDGGRGGAIVPFAGGATPPGGGGGFGGAGGFGGFGRALGGINLPGAGTIRELGDEFGFATKQVLLFGQAYKLLGIIQAFPAQVGAAVGQLQSFRNTLNAVTPSAEEARASNELLLGLMEKYNVPLQSARDGFTKLYASMAPAGFSGDEIRDLFTGITKAAATFGMSADKVDRVNYAFAQMASKGQVMSEELKGQLGDVLPGAMALFAEAAGFKGPKAIQDFSAALEDGAYKGEAMVALLKNVTVVMNKEFGPGAEGAALTFQGVMNRMQNSMTLLYEAFEPVAVGFLNTVVVPMTNGIKQLTDGLNAFFTGTAAKTAGGFAIAQELERLRPAFDGIGQNVAAFAVQLGQLAKVALDVSKIFLQIAGNPIVSYLAKLYAIALPLNIALGVMRGLWASTALQLVIFNARVASGTTTLSAFRGMMAATGATSQATAASIRTAGTTLRAFFATPGVGLVVVGISMLIERFMTMNQALADTKAKAMGAAQAIRSMSQTEARLEGQKIARTTKELQSLQKSKEVFKLGGEEVVPVKGDAAKRLEEAGVGIRRDLLGRTFIPKTNITAEILRQEGLQAEVSTREKQIKFDEKQAQTPAVLGVIPPGEGDAKGAQKAKNDAAQSLESLENLRDQLAKARMEGDMERAKILFEYQKRFDERRFELQESGANDVQKAGIKLAKDLFDVKMRLEEQIFNAGQAITREAGSVAPGSRPPRAPKGQSPYATAASTQYGPGAHQNTMIGQTVGALPGERPVSGSERRDIVAAEKTVQTTKTETLRLTLALRNAEADYAQVIKQNFDTIFPVAQLQLQNQLLAARYQLELQGVPKEAIDAQMAIAEARAKGIEMQKKLDEELVTATATVKKYNAMQEDGTQLTKEQTYELKNAEAFINAYSTSVGKAASQVKEFTIAQLENAIATMKQADALKALEEVSGRINQAVEGVTGTYKDMFKEIAKGGDSVDALKKAQEALADQALTMFFDFAMQPVEKFFKDQLGAIFGVPDEEAKRQEQLTAMEKQLAELKAARETQQKIDKNVEKIANGGEGATQSAPASIPGVSSPLALPGATGGLSSFIAGQSGTAISYTGATPATGTGMGSIGSYDWSTATENLDAATKSVAETVNETAKKTDEANVNWQEALGKTVQGIGIAAGSIMGIMAGIKQIEEGGTSNVLGGIGSILLSVGGAIGGFASMFKPAAAANGAVWNGGFRAFANGGMVTGPTLGLIGEGRYNEAIVPLPDGKSIPVQMRGQSSRDLLSDNARQQSSPVLSMSFQTTKFGDREYVDVAQLQAAMAETRKMAARDGANRGASLALDKLQNSPSARRKVGMR
jgi:tape measure domain-containing protein